MKVGTKVKLAILLLLSYFIGSLPFGYWVGKLFYQVDIRKVGSGNIGTTNTLRVLGPKAGVLVLLLDLFKGTLAGYLPMIFGLNVNPFIIGFGAIIGHTFSVWIGFKGGKAVATSAGVLLAYNPWLFLVASSIFVLIIFLSSMVSLASVIGFILITLTAFFMQDWFLTVVALILTIFVVYKHRENLKRIMHGNENLVHFGLLYWYRKKITDNNK